MQGADLPPVVEERGGEEIFPFIVPGPSTYVDREGVVCEVEGSDFVIDLSVREKQVGWKGRVSGSREDGVFVCIKVVEKD